MAKGCLISAAIVAAVVIGIIVVASFVVNDAANKAQRQLQTTTPSGETVTITLDEFNRIQTGMNKAEVQDIVGGPGRLLSQSDVGGFHDEVIEWGGEELGGNGNVTFQNDAVVSKAQFGLG